MKSTRLKTRRRLSGIQQPTSSPRGARCVAFGTDSSGQRRMLGNLGFAQLYQIVHNDWAWRKEETFGDIKQQIDSKTHQLEILLTWRELTSRSLSWGCLRWSARDGRERSHSERVHLGSLCGSLDLQQG